MSTEADTTTTTTTEEKVEKEVTIDDVYKDAGLDKLQADTTKQEVRQEVKQEVKVEPSSIPDPYDAENFKAYMAREAAGKTELTKAVQAVVQHLSADAQQKAIAATKADIESAVKAVNEVVGHPKPKVVEAAIDGMVRENPQLKAIWDNRAKNPGAWSKALSVVTKQIAEDFSVRVDPTLVASQRARKESQRQMATTTREEGGSAQEDRLAKATGADFDAEWQRAMGGQ